MSTLILSLLLLVLISVGLLMGAKVTERFENPENPELQATVIVSPALKNMMLSSVQAPAIPEQTELSREQDLQNARNTGHILGPSGKELGPRSHPMPKPEPTPSGCPVCPTCPDMSQYIRLDEVPCWNCTLP